MDVNAVFLLSIDDISVVLHAAAQQGFAPRISNPEAFARINRILLLRHTATGVDIDLSLGILPFEIDMVERSQVVQLGTLQLRLPTPEDLIIMKAIAHRPKDLADIQAVAASNPSLDRQRIQFWVEQFGEALEIPDLWNQISRLL